VHNLLHVDARDVTFRSEASGNYKRSWTRSWSPRLRERSDEPEPPPGDRRLQRPSEAAPGERGDLVLDVPSSIPALIRFARRFGTAPPA